MQNMDNRCARCEDRFGKWSEYHAHVTANICHKKILPIRTSTRTKQEIVRDMESTKLQGGLIR